MKIKEFVKKNKVTIGIIATPLSTRFSFIFHQKTLD